MIPPMNQKVTAEIPVLDDNGNPITDRYGRPQTTKSESKARVQFKSRIVRDNLGSEYEVALEVDLPRTFNPQVGTVIEYETIGGEISSGAIRAKEESTNLAGNRIYYRTAFVE